MSVTEEPHLKNLKNLCRICLQATDVGTYLFSGDIISKEILDKIYLCFQIILTSEKYLPRLICNSCTKELEYANSFRLKCVTFEERFNHLNPFNKQNTVDVTENLSSDNLIQTEDLNEYLENSIVDGQKKYDNSQNKSYNTCSKEPEYANSFRLKYVTFEERFNHLNQLVNKENTVDVTENLSSDDLIQTEDVNEYLEDSIDGQKQDGNSQIKSFQCEICNKIFKSKISFLKHNVSMHHKRKHIGKMSETGLNRRYHCTKCPYSTPHNQTLENHMRKHNGEKPYRCDCGKRFTRSSNLSAHQKTHTNLMMYTCSTCGKQLKHPRSLKKHQRVHEDAKFSCSLCEKTVKSQESLKAHMNRHYNVRNYNCEECGDTFVTQSELLNHRKTHEQELKVECHLCDYKTRTKKNLEIHLKRHAGDKPYKCDICNKAVYTQSDLRAHQRVHTRERPYPCPTCSQRFSYSGCLNQHVRSVHGLAYRWGDSKISQMRTSSVKLEKE